jgi:adenylate cyclase
MEATPAAAEGALLTPRQLEVLELMAKGLTNREIAGVLGISPGTVKVHVSAVIEALDVTNRTEAATRLHELGLGAHSVEVREEFTVPGFGARPAIAVLPFENFSSDPAQAHLADGIVEDLITRLAGWRWFPVISRNSTFVYKERAVDVTEVSRALGARYVVEGSVRRADERVRITVQLLDGETGRHVWAQHDDRELADVFTLEDEIVDSLVATLEPALLKLGGLRVLSRRPERLDAWESLQRGFFHASSNTWNGLREALPFCERAVELDPQLSTAHMLLGYCEFQLLLLGRVPDPLATLASIAERARKIFALDPTDPFAHLAVGWSHLLRGDPEGALASFDRSLELGPSVAWSHASRGLALNASGCCEDGCAAVERGIRLSPRDPLLHFFFLSLGLCHSALAQLSEAEEAFRRSIQEGPELPHGYGGLAAVLAGAGDLEGARDSIAKMREIDPSYSLLRPSRVFGPPGFAALTAELLRRAGWEEPGAG